MSSVIATVLSVDGDFYVKGEDGSLRKLSKGDEIYEGETVTGDKANSSLDSIIINAVDGGDIILIGSDSQLFDDSLSLKSFSTNETIDDKNFADGMVEETQRLLDTEATLSDTKSSKNLPTAAGENIAQSTFETDAAFENISNEGVRASSQVNEQNIVDSNNQANYQNQR